VRALTGNLATGIVIIWGQCSEAMKSKLSSNPLYEAKWKVHDCEWLLIEIRTITLQFDDKKNPFVSLLEAKAAYRNCKQGPTQTPHEYLEAMKALVDNIEYQGGSIAEKYTMIPSHDGLGRARDTATCQQMARDMSMGANYIRNADTDRYGTLIADLSNQYARGKDEYPRDITSACEMLVNYMPPVNTRAGRPATAPPSTGRAPAPAPAAAAPAAAAPEISAMTFAQNGSVAGSNAVTHDDVTCYNCNRTGHYSTDCPEAPRASSVTGTTLTQVAFVLAQERVPRHQRRLDPPRFPIHRFGLSECRYVNQHPAQPAHFACPHERRPPALHCTVHPLA
jgi:hypothetical protein